MGTSVRRFEYKTISARANRLLSRQEDLDVDFKTSLSGLEREDLVAFANSKTGGTILIGVDENTGLDGRQSPRIIGCRVGDKDKVRIINKANSCIPAVQTEVILENIARKPFFRIETPSGASKPYCTSGGTYKIREDGRLAALTPTLLLEMHLQAEGERFLKTFTESTAEVKEQLSDLQSSVHDWSVDTKRTLNEISGSASASEDVSDQARDLADEASSGIDQLSRKLNSVPECVVAIDERVEAILKHLGVADPITKRHFLLAAHTHLSNHPADQEGLRRLASETAKWLPEETLNSWIKEALTQFNKRERRRGRSRLKKNEPGMCRLGGQGGPVRPGWR